eukprot:Colp12_sorted_trinity150504_noHs@14861
MPVDTPRSPALDRAIAPPAPHAPPARPADAQLQKYEAVGQALSDVTKDLAAQIEVKVANLELGKGFVDVLNTAQGDQLEAIRQSLSTLQQSADTNAAGLATVNAGLVTVSAGLA